MGALVGDMVGCEVHSGSVGWYRASPAGNTADASPPPKYAMPFSAKQPLP